MNSCWSPVEKRLRCICPRRRDSAKRKNFLQSFERHRWLAASGMLISRRQLTLLRRPRNCAAFKQRRAHRRALRLIVTADGSTEQRIRLCPQPQRNRSLRGSLMEPVSCCLSRQRSRVAREAQDRSRAVHRRHCPRKHYPLQVHPRCESRAPPFFRGPRPRKIPMAHRSLISRGITSGMETPLPF
jgi:hypothetical protein